MTYKLVSMQGRNLDGYPITIDMAVCNDCGVYTWDYQKHDHYCPAKAQTPIGDVSPGAFIESIEMEQSK